MGIENDNDYQNAIQAFKDYVLKNNAEVSDRIHEGFLIDYKDYDSLTKNKGKKVNSNGSLCESFSNNKPNLIPKNPNNLRDQINSGDKFVLINKDFYNKICEREKNSNIHIIRYKISQYTINIYGDNNEVLKFKKNEINLIEIDNAANDGAKQINITVSKNIDKIYTDIINYHNIETKLQSILSIQNIQEQKYEGFFVDEVWDDKWKKCSYYNLIKERCLINNIIDKDKIIKIIKEEQTKKYFNYDEVYDVENYLAKNENEVYYSIKDLNKSYVILDKIFLNKFNIKKKFQPIPFHISYQNVALKPTSQTILNCKTNNNIISINNNIVSPPILNQQQNQMTTLNTSNNNLYTSEYLYHLIRTIYFKQEFILQNIQFLNKDITTYLIKKDIIRDLKEKFKLNELMFKIEKNSKLIDISYRNFKGKFHLILEAINESDSNYFNSIKKYDTPGVINITFGQSFLQKKNIYDKIGLQYIDNFEIIDEGFANFLYNRFNQQLYLPQANFIIKENYILLLISINNEYIYEILSFSTSCELTVEYLINFVWHKFNDLKQFNDYVFDYFIKKGTQKLITSGNPIRTENANLVFNIYPINYNKLRNSFNTTPDDNINNNQNGKLNQNTMNNNMSSKNPMNSNIISGSQPLQTFAQSNKGFNTNNMPNYNSDDKQVRNQIMNQPLLQTQEKLNFHIHNQFQAQAITFGQNNINSSKGPKRVFTQNNFSQNNPLIDSNIDELENILKIKMHLIKIQDALSKEINQSNTNRKILNKDCYLIRKTYLNELHLNQIKDIMNQHPGKNENEMLKILKEKFPNEAKIKIDLKKSLNELRDSNIYRSKLFYPKNNEGKNIYYFKNCDIITSEFITQLKLIDKNFEGDCLKVHCVFDMNKIIILLNNKIINISDYNGNEFYVKYIIKSDNPESLFEIIKQKGYNFISQYIPYNKVNIPIRHNYNIITSIYKLTSDGNIETRISNKLKALIFLYLSQYYTNYNIPQQVYLINPKWLKLFNYDKIKKLIYEKISNLQNLNLTDLNSVSAIISSLDKKKLDELDNWMNNYDPSIQFESSAEQIVILNRYFLVHTNFVLANQQCFEYLKNNFGINIKPADILYLKKNNEQDIIIMKNYPLYLAQTPNKIENLIIFGQLDTKNKYNINYICNYFDGNILDKELEDITKSSFKEFINKRAYMNQKIKNDYISPLFVNDQRVGEFFLYKKDFVYKKCYYYLNYLHNKQLMTSVYLFANKYNLYSRLKTQTPIDEEFYLIRKNIILDIKNKNQYEQYKKYFINKSHTNYIGDREKYLLIKNIPKDDLKYLNLIPKEESKNPSKNNTQINQVIVKSDIDITPIPNPSNPSEIYFIGKDFELIEKNCAHYLFRDLKPYNKCLCSFVGNFKIIFHYPINAFNNNKYNICVISQYNDNKKDFINEYLIKYNSQNSYQTHINQIKNNINNFISNLQFNNNNFSKIIQPGAPEIGTVIKLSKLTPATPQGPTSTTPQGPVSTSPIQTPLNNLPQQPTSTSTPMPIIPVQKQAPFPQPINNNQFQPNPPLKPNPPEIPNPPEPPAPDKITTRKYFDSKPLIGFENIGATCYMNATLQCLCNIEKFVDYFFSPHPFIENLKKEDKNNEKLSTSFKELIDNLYPRYNKEKTGFIVKNKKINITVKENKKEIKGYYAPREFKQKISTMNPLFEGIQANDAKDLVNFLVMTLHSELNKAQKNLDDGFDGNIFEDQRNKQLMFTNFTKNFMKTHQSIISDLFYALNYNMSVCLNCGVKTFNYQIYFFLIFPLEEVRKFKLEKINNNNNGNNNNGISNFNNQNYLNNMNSFGNMFNFNNNFVNNINFANANFANNFNGNNFQNNFNNNFNINNNNNFPFMQNNNFANNFPNNFNNNNFNNNMNINTLPNNNNNKPNEVDIWDCFDFDQRNNIMSGENAMYCNYCKQTCSSNMCTILATGPEILIIILNRGKGNEFKVKLNFTPFLDLTHYIEMGNTGCQYELIGVITHIGESSMSGHFIAYCKEYWTNTWLKFNDAMVDPVKNFQNEVIDFAMPYLLFYKKIHNNQNSN